MSKVISVGLAGYGFSGRLFHAPFILNDSRYKLAKIMVRNKESVNTDDIGDTVLVDSFDELLSDDIDLVIIATPNKTHVELAKAAIKAGKNVLVEKPIAPTAEEAQELCDLARDNNVLLTVYQSRRFDGDFMTVREVIESGAIGEVVNYECHYDRFAASSKPKAWKIEMIKGNGPLYNLGVHIIDQVYCLFGMPEEIYADFCIQRPDDNVFPDNFEIIFYYPDMKAIVSASEVVCHPGPHFMIHGRRGSFLKYGLDVQERDLVKGKRPSDIDWGNDEVDNYGILYDADSGKGTVVPTVRGNYGIFYDKLYKAILNNDETPVDSREAVEVLRIMEAALQSDKEKRRIKM